MGVLACTQQALVRRDLFFFPVDRGTHDPQQLRLSVGGYAKVYVIASNRPAGILRPVGMECAVSEVYYDGTPQGDHIRVHGAGEARLHLAPRGRKPVPGPTDMRVCFCAEIGNRAV